MRPVLKFRTQYKILKNSNPTCYLKFYLLFLLSEGFMKSIYLILTVLLFGGFFFLANNLGFNKKPRKIFNVRCGPERV